MDQAKLHSESPPVSSPAPRTSHVSRKSVPLEIGSPALSHGKSSSPAWNRTTAQQRTLDHFSRCRRTATVKLNTAWTPGHAVETHFHQSPVIEFYGADDLVSCHTLLIRQRSPFTWGKQGNHESTL